MPGVEKGHASLSASGSDRWMTCPGSVALIATLPKGTKSSPAAEEGTAAHEAAALCLQEGVTPAELAGRMFNGFEVTEEMVEALDIYVDYIAAAVERLKGSTLYVEKPFDLSFIRKDMWGTNDASISQPFGELLVGDLKYGKGVLVEVVDNSQLLYYATGALEETQDDPETVRMVIIQPRARHEDGPVRDWVVTADYVREWAQNELGPAADRARQPGAPLKAGDHCRWCDAAGLCPELGRFAADEAAIDFADPKVKEISVDMTEIDLTRAMKALPVVENWCRAVMAAGQQWLESGRPLEGFKLVRGKSNRRWKDEAKTIKTFRSMRVSVKEYMTEPKLVSPAQAEKLKKVSKQVVELLAEKPEGKATIVPDSDPRMEIAPPAETDFAAVDIPADIPIGLVGGVAKAMREMKVIGDEIKVGDTVTVSGTGKNDGEYTVIEEDFLA
ncbi:MAG: DUF2800 domain-containing protein [Dehalococcoidales bacterium]